MEYKNYKEILDKQLELLIEAQNKETDSDVKVQLSEKICEFTLRTMAAIGL